MRRIVYRYTFADNYVCYTAGRMTEADLAIEVKVHGQVLEWTIVR